MEALSSTKQEDMVDVNLKSTGGSASQNQAQSGGCACWCPETLHRCYDTVPAGIVYNISLICKWLTYFFILFFPFYLGSVSIVFEELSGNTWVVEN
jgi:Ras-related protein Rab-6A